MRRAIDIVRRIVMVSAIVLFSGAMTCVTIEGGIQFAPGYGYVVDVERNDAKSFHFLYVFDTLEEAQRWTFEFQQNPSKLQAMGNPGYRRRVSEEYEFELYKKIVSLLRPPPPSGAPLDTIDRVVPPVPIGPAPQ